MMKIIGSLSLKQNTGKILCPLSSALKGENSKLCINGVT